MSIIKVEVKRKSDGELVYGNEGDQSLEAVFDADTAKFDSADYNIVKTDVTALAAAKQLKVDIVNAARSNLEAINLDTATISQADLKDLIRLVLGVR